MLEKHKSRISEAMKGLIPDGPVVFTDPPSLDKGDIGFPCFPLAKAFRKSPADVAAQLQRDLPQIDGLDRIEADGGYLNFHLNRRSVVEETISEVRQQGDRYGSSREGCGKSILVEHTSINPNASPHVGRARNALIGDALVRLFRFQGYDVEAHYFVNDVGKQIAMLVIAARAENAVTFQQLLSLYVEINRRIEQDTGLEDEVFGLLRAFEQGDRGVREEFRRIVDICVRGQTEILTELGSTYDTFQYESEYIFSGRTAELLEKLRNTGRLREDEQGRLVLDETGCNVPEDSSFLVLTRADGTSLYPLRDIAYTIEKMKAAVAANVVVLGEDQKLYFRQVKAALELLGHAAPTPVHYAFVLLKDGSMSTRKGTVVLLEDFMREAVERARQQLRDRYETVNERTAKAVAYGAAKYAMLKIANERNVVFDWDSALSFEGDTGPYLLYSCARINSIIRKSSSDVPSGINYSLLTQDAEYQIVKQLGDFPSVVSQSLGQFAPNLIANYLFTVAKSFSAFYHVHPVLRSGSDSLTAARLALIDAVRQVLSNGMCILGIDPVESM